MGFFVFSCLQVKSLARSENTVTKVFANTTTVSPMHIFYTSNEKLFKHKIPSSMSRSGFSLSYWSQADSAAANPSQVKKRQTVSAENLEAIRSRFLEMYCFNTPKQEQKDLDAAGTFTRENFICGMFDRALETLERYSPDSFHSLYLPAYVISALCKNLDLVEEIMCCSSGEDEEGKQEPEKQEGMHKPVSEAETSDWEDDSFFGNLPLGLLEGKKEDDPNEETEKQKKKKDKKPQECRHNHRERVASLRKKYNLTFL